MMSLLVDFLIGGFVGWHLVTIISMYRRGISTWSREEWWLWAAWSVGALYGAYILTGLIIAVST